MDIVALRERFQPRLLSRIDSLEEDLRGGMDAETAARSFHSIAGIAGTVGYPEATTVALEAEEICIRAFDVRLLEQVCIRLRESIRSDGSAATM